MKLTKPQRDVLECIGSQKHGVTDISDETIVRCLVDKGLVLKFFESAGLSLDPVWTITEAGRSALKDNRP